MTGGPRTPRPYRPNARDQALLAETIGYLAAVAASYQPKDGALRDPHRYARDLSHRLDHLRDRLFPVDP